MCGSPGITQTLTVHSPAITPKKRALSPSVNLKFRATKTQKPLFTAPSTFSYSSRLNQHTPVSFVGPRIEPHIPLKAIMRLGCRNDYTLRPGQQEVFRNLDAALSTILDNNSLPYVSQIQGIPFDPRKDSMTCDTLYWSDGDHWTAAGAARFVGRLVQEQTLALP
jgi:hypothetical protein